MNSLQEEVRRLQGERDEARAEVEQLRAEVQLADRARRIADRIDAPLIAAALRDLWQTQNWSDALIGEVARELLVVIGVRAAREVQR